MIENASYQQLAIDSLTQQHPGLSIDLAHRPEGLADPLYTHAPMPQLTLTDLRAVTEEGSAGGQSAVDEVVFRVGEFVGHVIRVLETNEECRLSWSEGSKGGRIERAGRVSLELYYQQVNTLTTLIEECRHGVGSKSQLAVFIEKRKDIVCRQWEDGRFLRSIRQLLLPEMPIFYEHLPLMTEDSYLIIYDSTMQRLLGYRSTLDQFRAGRANASQIQQFCGELIRQDLISLGGSRINELIKYAWHHCYTKFATLQKLRGQIHRLRHGLISSMLRAHFIATMAKGEIMRLEESLQRVEGEMLSKVPHGTSKFELAAARASFNEAQVVDEVNYIQALFNRVLSYLTDTPETIFLPLYQRKLKKRINRLFAIEARLTHLFKLRNNEDYAEAESERKRRAELLKHKRGLLPDKFKQIDQMLEEMKPLNDNKFKIIFEELQRLGIFISEAEADEEWRERLVRIEKGLLNGYLFDAEGKRCFKKEDPLQKFSRSRVSVNGNSSYQVSLQDVFEEPIKELDKSRKEESKIVEKAMAREIIRGSVQPEPVSGAKQGQSRMSLPLQGGRLGRDSIASEPKQDKPASNQTQQRGSLYAARESQWRLSKQQRWEQLANLDRQQVFQEAKDYLDEIKPEMGEEFLDLSNFKGYLLPKLIDKVDFCLQKTSYSQQPLFLQLTGLSENLHLIRQVIRTELNEQKISLIFYPRINSTLFTTLRTAMLEHQSSLRALREEVGSSQIKDKAIEPHIKQFMEARLKYLFVLLENIDKLEEIAITVDGLNLNREFYEISSEASNNLVLKLLLAEKQLKVYREAVKDRINNQQLSQKALQLLAQYIYPNFIKSLSLIFQLDPQRPAQNHLQHLLELSEQAKGLVADSTAFMETAVKLAEDIRDRSNQRSGQEILQQIGVRLRAYETQAEQVVFECNKYKNISGEEVKRQGVRLQEFITACEGERGGADIVDEGARKFMEVIEQLAA